MANEEDINKLQADLEKYQREYRETMERAAANASNDQETFDSILDYFKSNTSMAAAQIVWLMQHSTSDSTRMAASKYVIEVVRRGIADDNADPVKEILKTLMENPGKRIAPNS